MAGGRLALLVPASLSVTVVAAFGLFRAFDRDAPSRRTSLALQDLVYRTVSQPPRPHRALQIVDIDTPTFDRLGGPPLPRAHLTEWLSALTATGATDRPTIAWDLLFLGAGARDEAFSGALGRTKSIVPLPASVGDPTKARSPGGGLAVVNGLPPLPHGVALPQLVRSDVRVGFGHDAELVAHVAQTRDVDGVTRRVALVAELEGRVVPSLGLAAFLLFRGLDMTHVDVRPGEVVVQDDEGPITVALDDEGLMLVPIVDDWRMNGLWTSFRAELREARHFDDYGDTREGRLFFVGTSAAIVGDSVDLVGQPSQPGLLVWANVTNALLKRDLLRAAPGWLDGLVLVLGVLAIGLAFVRLDLAAAGWIAATVAVAGVGLQVALLAALRMSWRGTELSLAWSALAFGLALWRARADERRHAKVRSILGRFVSPALLAEIERTGDAPSAPQRRELTVLFIDIAGFTAFSRQREPEEVSLLLAEFYEVGMRVLFAHQGTLDEFKGDGLLAYFGAPSEVPDKERRAIEAACAIRDEFGGIAARNVERFGGERMHVRSAIATGYVSVGYFGGHECATYGIVGTTVNIAARLQGLAEPDQVLLDEATAARVRADHALSSERAADLKGLGRTTYFEVKDSLE